jgi:FkbM family methyltransferase
MAIVDIGSHYGFFSTKIARYAPRAFVWSIEADEDRAAIQREVLTRNNLSGVVLSQYLLSLNDLIKLNRTTESFDMVLALSVVHYFDVSEILQILQAFSQLAESLVIEFPSSKECNVSNKCVVDILRPGELLDATFEVVTHLGSTPSPNDRDVMRPLFLARNRTLARSRLTSYIGADTDRSHSLTLDQGEWFLDGQRKQWNGLNLHDLLCFKPIHPTPEGLLARAEASYATLMSRGAVAVSDIHPGNFIVSSDGCHPIDYA